jgi:hypothetical protein
MIKILLLLVLVIVIFFMFDLKENFDVTDNIFTQKSNEAIQNIAKIYADASGTVMFNNVNASQITASQINSDNMMTKTINADGPVNISNKLIVSGETQLKSLDVLGNLNAKDIRSNNLGMVLWRQQIEWGRPQNVQAKDPNGNIYDSDNWVVYNGGWNVNGIGRSQTYIKDKTWWIRLWAISDPVDNHVDLLAIPKSYFSNVFVNTLV